MPPASANAGESAEPRACSRGTATAGKPRTNCNGTEARPEAVASAATPTHPERFATARPVPVMVGKIDVSHFAGIERGDTPRTCFDLWQPDEDRGTYQIWANRRPWQS